MNGFGRFALQEMYADHLYSKPGRYPMLSMLNFRVGIKTKSQVIDPSFATHHVNLIID